MHLAILAYNKISLLSRKLKEMPGVTNVYCKHESTIRQTL